MSDALDARILAAHDEDDRRALVRLYSQAANIAGDVDAECFFLTYAYIYALEMGAPETDALRTRLKAYGREE